MVSADPYRKVLLVLLANVPSRRVLDAACSLCDRLGAGLEVVGLGKLLPADLLDATAREVGRSGLSCSASSKPDWAIEELVGWANSRSCVATVMLPASERTGDGRAWSDDEGWQHLDCPLVVVGHETIDE